MLATIDHYLFQIPKPPRRPPEGFPGKTPVITDERIMHMRDVSRTHRVLDRNGSWQPVTDVHRRKGSTVRVSGHGHAGIEASDGHPVLVRATSNGGTPGWMSAGLLDKGSHALATPTHIDPLPIPGGAPETPAEWHLVGSYLRSGAVTGDRITIKAADKREAQHIRQHVAGALGAGREHQGGVIFEGRDREQAQWLAEHFGDKPHTKTCPPWALGMDETHRRALLRGYYGPDWKPLPTTSPFLATGMRLVAETLGERTDIEHVFAPFRPTYQARRLDAGHGHSGLHSWLGNQQARKAVRQQKLWDLEVGDGGSFVAGIGGKVVSACGEKPTPKPDARSRVAAKPPATAARNGGGGGSNGRSAQSPASKPRRMPRSMPSVASIADALGHSVPVIGGRKPRTPQRDTAGVVPLTPAQEQRVQQGIRSLDGVQREEAMAELADVPQSARAREAARVAEDRLNQHGVSVAELASMRKVDALNEDIPGTAASSHAKHRGLVRQDVHDVLAAERPAREQRVIRDWNDATTINHLGKVTAEQFLPGNLAHPNGHPDPDPETALINDPLVRLNNAGFVTIGSQAGMANSVGYGGDIFHQNAAVEGFATPEAAQRIRDAAEAEGLTVIQHSGAARRRDYSDIDRESDFGTHLSRSDVDHALGNGVNKDLRRELHNAEQIAVVDPQVGRNDRLERFAQRMDEQRRSTPINDAWMVDDLNGLPPGTTENDMRRARGEVVPDLRDELRTPAERQERAARMAAAEQPHAEDRERTVAGERPVVDEPQPTLPLDTPVHDAVGRDGFDGFAADAERRGIAATPEHAAQPVVTRVDGRPVTAEIVDMAGAVGERHAGLQGAEQPRLDAGSQEPDLIQQIAAASALREAQAVPIERNEAGHLHAAGAPMAATIDAPRVSGSASGPVPATDTQATPYDAATTRPEPSAPRAVTTPTDITATEAFRRRIAQSGFYERAEIRAEAMRHTLADLPDEDRDARTPQIVSDYQRSLRDDWERDVGPNLAMPKIPSQYLGDLERHLPDHPEPRIDPPTLARQTDRPAMSMQQRTNAEWQKIMATQNEVDEAGRQGGYPEGVIAQTRAQALDEKWDRGGFGVRTGTDRPDGDSIPWPTANRDAQPNRITNEEVNSEPDREPWSVRVPANVDSSDLRETGRHRSNEQGEDRSPDAAPPAPSPEPHSSDVDGGPQSEEREHAKPVDDAEEARTTDRPDEASRPEDPINEDAQSAERTEPKPDPKPDPEPEREPADRTTEPEPEPNVKTEPDKPKDPEPNPEPDPEPERAPRQWEKDAKEAAEPAHSEPEPEAPSHYMGPEL